jgi:hypothetical protein
MKKIYLLLVMTAIGLQAWCQKDTSAAHPLITHFQLRQSFETSDEQEDPAKLQFTLPGGGKNSWLIDAAIGFTIPDLSKGAFTSKFAAEYHRNTSLVNVQNNYQFGYNLRWFERGDRNFKLILTGNAKFVRDVADTSSSIAVTFNLSGYKRKGNGVKWNRPTYLDNYKFTYCFSPYFAGQYQQLITANTKQATGVIFRPILNASGSFAINKPMVDKETGKRSLTPPKLIELLAGYTALYAVVNTTASNEGYTKLFKTGVNYYFLDNNSASISLGGNYNIGSDPLNGLKNQNFWQFTLQVEI